MCGRIVEIRSFLIGEKGVRNPIEWIMPLAERLIEAEVQSIYQICFI